MKYWIKQRNSQGLYFKLMGQMPAKEAKTHKQTLAGHNVMLSYPTKRAYEVAIAQLRAQNHTVLD